MINTNAGRIVWVEINGGDLAINFHQDIQPN